MVDMVENIPYNIFSLSPTTSEFTGYNDIFRECILIYYSYILFTDFIIKTI